MFALSILFVFSMSFAGFMLGMFKRGNNKKILALLESQLYIPIPEDEIPWNTSANVLESAIITDFSV